MANFFLEVVEVVEVVAGMPDMLAVTPAVPEPSIPLLSCRAVGSKLGRDTVSGTTVSLT